MLCGLFKTCFCHHYKSKSLLPFKCVFALSVLTNLRIKDTFIQCAAARFTAFLWPVLLFPLAFCGTRGWNEHLVFLPLSDWLMVDSLGAIVLLEAVRPSALSSVSLHNLPRCVCPSSISHHRIRSLWKLHHTLLWLAVTVVVGCTLCVTDVYFYSSLELRKHCNVGYRCIFLHVRNCSSVRL